MKDHSVVNIIFLSVLKISRTKSIIYLEQHGPYSLPIPPTCNLDGAMTSNLLAYNGLALLSFLW